MKLNRLNKLDFNMKYMILIILFVIISVNVSALGVTPGREVVDFMPDKEGVVKISLINNENKDMRVAVFLEGEENIVKSFELSSSLVEFNSGQGSKEISYNYKLSDSLIPGEHQIKVVARELPGDDAISGTSLGATVAVVHQFRVNVPYPGKFATAELKVAETGKTDSVNFIMPVNNFGTQRIVEAKGIIDIYGPTNDKIATIVTDSRGIESGNRIELTGEWNENVNVGRYLAKATVVYDGEVTSEIERVFIVGNQDLELLDVYVDDFSLGDIAKFNILVQNNWNQKIDDLFAEMIVYDKDEEVIRFKSATENVDSLAKQELTAFWDTEGIDEGEYNLNLALHSSDRVTEEDIKMVVSLNSINFLFEGVTGRAVGGNNLGSLQMGTIITVGLFIVILVIGIYFYFRKRKSKEF